MMKINRFQGNKLYYYASISIPFLLVFLCAGAEIYYVNYSETRWHDILKTIGRYYLHICDTQRHAVISGCAFLIFFLFFFIYLTRYLENHQYDIIHIFSFTKQKTYCFLAISIILYIPYFYYAFREIRKTTPGNCTKLKEKHDALFQTWNWDFRENWEKVYDTSFIFYNLVCFFIYRKKINLLIASTIGIVLLTIALIYYFRSNNNYNLLA